MDRAQYKRFYDLHSWSGVIFGLFIYVVAVSGCFALFYHEILAWEDPAKRIELDEQSMNMDGIFTDWIESHSMDKEVDRLRISYPSYFLPYYVTVMRTRDQDGHFEVHGVRWDPQTGRILPTRGDGLSFWILDFHRALMWPEALGGFTGGLAVVGLAGAILLLSIASGLVTHRKFLKKFFTLRFGRSEILKWKDSHKILGLWGLPFYAMMAFTGLFLGTVTLIGSFAAILTFGGDEDALAERLPQEAVVVAAGVPATMLSIDKIGQMTDPDTGAPVTRFLAQAWGDANAELTVSFAVEEGLGRSNMMKIHGVTGERIDDGQIDQPSMSLQVKDAITTLHFATYGGVALKFLYLALGIALAVMTVLGLVLWLKKQRHSGRLQAVVMGTCLGLPLAYGVIFALDKLYLGAEHMRLFWTGTAFFSIWGLVIFLALTRVAGHMLQRAVAVLIFVLFASLPFLNGLTTGDWMFVTEWGPSAYVDGAILVISMILFWIFQRVFRRDRQLLLSAGERLTAS